MTVIDRIVEFLFDASIFTYNIYLEVYSWIYPFSLAAGFFYQLSNIFASLARSFYDFGVWIDSIISQLATFLSWSNLEMWFKDWKTKILDAWNWIVDAWNNIWNEVDDWWATTKPTVKGWITTATEGLATLKADWNTFWTITFPGWTNKLDTVKTAWDNFWTVTFPDLVSFKWLTTWWDSRWKEVDSLIDSWFKKYEPFWSGWQDWKDKIIEFFTDPEEWLYKAIDRLFERFW